MDVGGKYLAIVFGLMNMIGNLGAGRSCRTCRGWRSSAAGELALGTFVAMHVAALACWLVLNPNVVVGEPSRKE